jgi:hypothetical protein
MSVSHPQTAPTSPLLLFQQRKSTLHIEVKQQLLEKLQIQLPRAGAHTTGRPCQQTARVARASWLSHVYEAFGMVCAAG